MRIRRLVLFFVVAALLAAGPLSAQDKEPVPVILETKLNLDLPKGANVQKLDSIKHDGKWYVYLRVGGATYLAPIIVVKDERADCEVRVDERANCISTGRCDECSTPVLWP